MADMIKRNWLLLTIILVTLGVNGVLGFLTVHTSKEVKKAEEDLKEQREEVKRTKVFQKTKYGLTPENMARSQANEKTAWSHYGKDSVNIVKKFDVAKYNKSFAETPFAAKGFVESRCESMRQDMASRNIALAESVKAFTFADIIDTGDLPPGENVEFIIRNVLIVDDIVKLLYQSGLSAITKFERGKLKLEEQDGVYKYLPFSLSIEGDYNSIRKFINRLNDSNSAGYLYILRNFKIQATDLTSKLGGSAARETGTPAGRQVEAGAEETKAARIAFKTMATVKADFDFDYVEFIEKAPK